MNSNPYAPPGARVDDVGGSVASPELWNPSAAAKWSLLFSPVFGSYLHMRNWQAIGDAAKATNAWMWLVSSVVVVVVIAVAGTFLPESRSLDSGLRGVGLALLITWYMSSGKAQVKYVEQQFGDRYPRKGWAAPIAIAIGCLIGLFVALVGIILLAGSNAPT